MSTYVRTTTVDSAPSGDSVKQAILDLDTDLTGHVAAYNTHVAAYNTHVAAYNTHDTATTAVHGFTGTKTGSGAMVGATSPTLVTPVISGHCTIEGVTPTGATGTGKFVFDTSPTIATPTLTTPTVSGHATIEGVTLTGATGTGKLVFDTSPKLVTPVLGVATATSINKVALTAPATSCTLTIANGKTLTCSNTLTFAGTDSTTITFPTTSCTVARTDAANSFTGTQQFGGMIDLASGQIKFPATASASANANTLDDYEEGTWTPYYAPATGNNFVSATYDVQYGRYTKIGRLVICDFTLRTDAIDKGTATGSAGVRIAGLPFPNSGITIYAGVGVSMTFTTTNPTNFSIGPGVAYLLLTINNSTTALTVDNLGTGTNANMVSGYLIYY